MDRADDASLPLLLLLLVPLAMIVVVAIGVACKVVIRTEYTEPSSALHGTAAEVAVPGALTKSTKAWVEERGAGQDWGAWRHRGREREGEHHQDRVGVMIDHHVVMLSV